MEWGKHREFLEEQEAETGRRPPALDRRVALKRHEVWLWQAFQVLSAGRPQGFNGVPALPVSEINAYCDMAGMAGPDERLRFCRIMQRLDMAYREKMTEMQPSPPSRQ